MQINNVSLYSQMPINTAYKYNGQKIKQLEQDTFIKSSALSFKGEKSDDFFDVDRKILNLLSGYNNADFSTKMLLELYEESPDLVERSLSADITDKDSTVYFTIDNMFGGKTGIGAKLGLYGEYGQYGRYKSISLFDSELYQSNDPNSPSIKALKALSKEIVQKNPSFFKWNNIMAMYKNNNFVEVLTELARQNPENVFRALERTNRSEPHNEHLLIDNDKITPERQELFKTLLSIDHNRTATIVSTLSKKRLQEFSPDKSSLSAPVQKFIDEINSKDDTVESNKKLIELAEQSPDAAFKALTTFDNKTGDFYVNGMLRDKKRNYFGVMLYLLSADPGKFFEMADKTNCLWDAAGNETQLYLDLFEGCLLQDPEKTKDLLLKKQKAKTFDFYNSTTIQRCVDNKGFDYTELLKAYYQIAPGQAFEIFNSSVAKDEYKTGKRNLLTYYVDAKKYMAEDFISYLTSQNLLYARQLLSRDTLTKIKDLKYKMTMDSLRKVEEESDNKLSGLEAQVMKAVIDVNRRVVDIQRQTQESNFKFDNELGKVRTVLAEHVGQLHIFISPDDSRKALFTLFH